MFNTGLCRFYKWKVLPKIKGSRGATRILKTLESVAVRNHREFQLNNVEDYKPWLYEPVLVDAVKSRVEELESFADIGGFTGYYTVLAALNGCQVKYFDINVDNHNRAYENLKLNKVSENVEMRNIGLSNENSTVKVRRDKASTEIVEDQDYDYEAGVYRFDDIVTEPVDLIKIDVEGHEPQVLEGMQNHLTEHLPEVFIEVHCGHGVTVSQVKNRFPENYRFFQLQEKYGEVIIYACPEK